MDNHKCYECGHKFTSREEFDYSDSDVVEQKVCDTVEGQFVEWFQVRCPECDEVVEEWGR